MGQRVIMASSHIDKHNTIIMPEALEQMKNQINGDRAVKVSFEHNSTIPPLGQIANAETIIDEKGYTLLVCETRYFDEKFTLISDKGEELYVERFKDGGRPFNNIVYEEIEKVEIAVDLINLENKIENLESFETNLKNKSDYDFTVSTFGRKSEIPDPEILIKLTPEIALYLLGLTFLFKFVEKVGERMGDSSYTDGLKFYDFIKMTAINIASIAVPKLKPITYVFQINGVINIELVVVTRNPDVLTESIKRESVEKVAEKIKSLMIIPKIEKMQFIYNEEQQKWEFNYLLTENGEVIGTPKSYNNRTKFIEGVIESNKLIKSNETD